jgi:hypothetical protein
MIFFIKKLLFKKFEFEKDGKKYLFLNGEIIEVVPVGLGSNLKGVGGLKL